MRGLHDVVCGLVHGEMTVPGTVRGLGRRWLLPLDLPRSTVDYGGKCLLGKVYLIPARWARPYYLHRDGACGSVGNGDETLDATLAWGEWAETTGANMTPVGNDHGLANDH